MEKPALNNQISKNLPVLVVDKEGIIGSSIAKIFSAMSKVCLVTAKNENLDKDIYRILYKKNKIPLIPDLAYSKIIIVWSGEKEILEFIHEFIKKSKNEKSDFIFITNLLCATEALIKKVKEIYSKTTIFVTGDLFGQGEFGFESPVNKILSAAKLQKKIIIENDGLKKIFPVFFEDAIGIIKNYIVDRKIEGRTYFVFQKHSSTEISFARVIQKIDPEIILDFVPNIYAKETRTPEEGDYILEKDYDLKPGMNKFLEAEINRPKQEEKRHKASKNNKASKKTFFLILLFVFFCLSLPLISMIVFSFFGANLLINAKNKIESGDFENAINNVRLAERFFDVSLDSSKVLIFEAKIFGKENQITSFASSVETVKGISSAVNYSLNGFIKIKKTLEGKSNSPREDFIDGIGNLKGSIKEFREIQARDSLSSIEKSILSKTKDLKVSIEIFENISDVLPNILGFEGKKNYLILFQNNMELRPGGGFIGSYGLVTLDKGKVLDFSINDIYDADGQLKGHVEPPYPIRRYLPSAHLYFRDSNFSPDFPKNASSAAFFLNQEKGEIVDGVIAMDVSFVKSIIDTMGPIYVSDYKETVTGENFYLLTQNHAEKNFFPGSTQKKDFLRSVFNTLLLNFGENKKTSYFSLVKMIGDSIMEKHFLFAFQDQSVQSLFTINKMSSSLWDTRETNTFSISDFVGLSEANLGVNKTNYFIKRKIDHEFYIKDNGDLVGKANVSYKNTSPKENSWPGGDYKNYVRFLLPYGSDLTSITIDGQDQKITPAITDFSIYEAKNYIPPKELEVEKTTEFGKTIYGFLVIVPTGELKTISITYKMPQKISLEQNVINYDLLLFKQPGTENDQFSSRIYYPEQFRVTKTSAGLTIGEKSIEFSGKLNQDMHLNVEFSKK